MITRRGLLQLLASVPIIGSVALVQRRYGPMTIARHLDLQRRGIHLHVWHRGKDITQRCIFADDTGTGQAVVLLHDQSGKPYLRGKEVAKEKIYGVTFREGEPFS